MKDCSIAHAHLDEGRYLEALGEYLKCAEEGSTVAAVHVGWMYEIGKGIAQDKLRAEKWYLKASEMGSPVGAFYLANLYRNHRDYSRSIKYYKISADQNFGPALYRLGMLYIWGEGVTRDDATGIKFIEKAAEQNHLLARRTIAIRMMKGGSGFFGIFLGFVRFFSVLLDALKISAHDLSDTRLLR